MNDSSNALVPFPLPDAEGMPDLRIEVRVRNNRLLRAIKERYGSTAEMCRTEVELIGHQVLISALITFRMAPCDEHGNYREICRLLEEILGIPREELFPLELYDRMAGRSTLVREVHSSQMQFNLAEQQRLALPAPEKVVQERFFTEALLETLRPRERQIVKLHFGLLDGVEHSSRDIANVMQIDRASVNYTVAKALRKLRYSACQIKRKLSTQYLIKRTYGMWQSWFLEDRTRGLIRYVYDEPHVPSDFQWWWGPRLVRAERSLSQEVFWRAVAAANLREVDVAVAVSCDPAYDELGQYHRIKPPVLVPRHHAEQYDDDEWVAIYRDRGARTVRVERTPAPRYLSPGTLLVMT